MTTALDIVNRAFNRARVELITSFSTTQDGIGSIALDLLNDTIRRLNQLGNFWFMETVTDLPYSASVSSYNLGTLEIEPRSIIRVSSEVDGVFQEIQALSYGVFQRYKNTSSVGVPSYWATFNNILYLSSTPDADYDLKVYHYKPIPLVTATTDVLSVPEQDESVISDGVYALLCQAMGRSDADKLYMLWEKNGRAMTVKNFKSAAMPTSMPRAF